MEEDACNEHRLSQPLRNKRTGRGQKDGEQELCTKALAEMQLSEEKRSMQGSWPKKHRPKLRTKRKKQSAGVKEGGAGCR